MQMTQPNLSVGAAKERNYHDQRMGVADFDQAPFTIAWEVTRACAFACVHCRADAIPQRDPLELDILHRAKRVGISVQVNTTVTTFNVDLLPQMVTFVEQVGAVQWSVFFMVPTGRAQAKYMISPEQHERTFHWLYDLSKEAPFDIKATAAPMYRRVAIERKKSETDNGSEVIFQGAGFQYADGLHRPRKGVNDGNGFLFISHLGEIQPSGFLPITAGNVRQDDIVEVYRTHPIFRDLRDPSKLKGRCGRCEYKDLCGGQRGRAYGLTGDYLAEDPACLYVPEGTRSELKN
jgi:radical SAM protein with 4Fe4S-binding SPASM domain